MFEFINSPWIWFIFIAAVWANTIHFLVVGRKHYLEKPELKPGYFKIGFGFAALFTTPFFIGFLGQAFGGMKLMEDYFYLNIENPFSALWWLSIGFLDVFLVTWIFFFDGAKKLQERPGFFNHLFYTMGLNNEGFIKAIILFALVGQIVAIFLRDTAFTPP